MNLPDLDPTGGRIKHGDDGYSLLIPGKAVRLFELRIHSDRGSVLWGLYERDGKPDKVLLAKDPLVDLDEAEATWDQEAINDASELLGLVEQRPGQVFAELHRGRVALGWTAEEMARL